MSKPIIEPPRILDLGLPLFTAQQATRHAHIPRVVPDHGRLLFVLFGGFAGLVLFE
jgi:hypothetical protein